MSSTKVHIQTEQRNWETAKFSASSLRLAGQVAQRLVAPKAKAVYQGLERTTGVPWFVIAVIHEREASQRWDRSIAQGDRWDRVSVNKPRGRGPFRSFNEAAYDALVNCAPYASKWKDWSAGGSLTLLGLYNGTGYEIYHHMESPYLWAGTQHYVRGKYVSDGKFDPNEVDHQLGCAVLLKKMMELDDTVNFGDVTPEVTPVPPPRPAPAPAPAPEPEEDEKPQMEDNDQMGKEPETGGLSDVVKTIPKTLMKSKTAWLQTLLGFFGLGTVGSQVDSSVLTQVWHIVSSPGFMGLVVLVCVGFTIYWRWADHGRGAAR